MFKLKSSLSKAMQKQILVLSIISIITISILSQNANASILSASTKNPPQATADLLTLNNTSGTHLWWIDVNGKMFASSNADFHSSTSVFDSTKLCIRNPASTFTTCVTNSAVTANRTLTWPLITGTDTLATLGLAQTFTGADTFTSNTVNFTQGLTVSAGQKIFLTGANGGTKSVIYEAAPGQVRFYAGNAQSLTLFSTSPFIQFPDQTTGSSATGIGGSNCPAVTCTGPFDWLTVRDGTGTTVYIPAWK